MLVLVRLGVLEDTGPVGPFSSDSVELRPEGMCVPHSLVAGDFYFLLVDGLKMGINSQ